MAQAKEKENELSNVQTGVILIVMGKLLQGALGGWAELIVLGGIGVTCATPLTGIVTALLDRCTQPTQNTETGNIIKGQMELVMQKAGLKNKDGEFAIITDTVQKEKYIDLYAKLPVGVARSNIEDTVDAMQTYFKSKVMLMPASHKDENVNRQQYNSNREGLGVVKLRMYTAKLPESVPFKIMPLSEKVDINDPKDLFGSLWFCFGQGLDGPMWCDLVKDNAYIAGEIGSGKSILTHVILLQLMSSYSPDQLQIEINDYKDGIEFEDYQKLPHVSHYSADFSKIKSYLDGIEDEMRARIQRIKSVKGCRNLADYNCAVKEEDRIPRKVILLEEMVVILGLEPKEARAVKQKLAVICSQARAAGIHVICTTQRPSKEVIDPLIKTNINARFGLLTVDENNSKIIIDRPGCNLLRGSGHGIFKFGAVYDEFQTMHATPKIQYKLIDEIEEKYKSVTPAAPLNQMKQLLEESEDTELDDIYQRCI